MFSLKPITFFATISSSDLEVSQFEFHPHGDVKPREIFTASFDVTITNKSPFDIPSTSTSELGYYWLQLSFLVKADETYSSLDRNISLLAHGFHAGLASHQPLRLNNEQSTFIFHDDVCSEKYVEHEVCVAVTIDTVENTAIYLETSSIDCTPLYGLECETEGKFTDKASL